MGKTINERMSIATHDCTEDIGAETSPADSIQSIAFVKLDKFDKFIAIGASQGAASAVVETLTLYQATAAAGTGSTTLSTTVTDTATSTNTTDLLLTTCECDASDLDTANSNYWIGARLTSSGASDTASASIVGIRVAGRFDPQSN